MFDDPQQFTAFVDGTREAWGEKEKSLDARDRSLKLLFISIIFSLASFFTIPLEVISKLRQGRFSLWGFGFLCPIIAFGTYALSIHYSKYHLYHDRMSLILNPTDYPEDFLNNLALIVQAAHNHFENLRSDIHKHPAVAPEALPLLIKLHFLQKHCINLIQSKTMKGIDGHYPSYTQLFTLNVDFLSGSPEKKREMIANRVTLMTTKDGKSLSFADVCQELGLQNATS